MLNAVRTFPDAVKQLRLIQPLEQSGDGSREEILLSGLQALDLTLLLMWLQQPLLCSDFWSANLKRVKFCPRDRRFVSVLIFNLSVLSTVVTMKHFSPQIVASSFGFKSQTALPNVRELRSCAKCLSFFRGGCAPLTFSSSFSIVFWIFNQLISSNCYTAMEKSYGSDSLIVISAIVRSGFEHKSYCQSILHIQS